MGTLTSVMTEPVEIPVEAAPDELGQRLCHIRLTPRTDPTMEASLRRYGQLSPVVAFRDRSKRLEVIDGFRRLRSAVAQGHPGRLHVRVLDVDEPGALTALFALHRGSTGLTELEEGWVVRALVREYEISQTQVAQLLRRHQSWVSRRLMLVEALAPEVQIDVRLGLCSRAIGVYVPCKIRKLVYVMFIIRHGPDMSPDRTCASSPYAHRQCRRRCLDRGPGR